MSHSPHLLNELALLAHFTASADYVLEHLTVKRQPGYQLDGRIS
jgi:hypothetical protein